MSRKPKPKGTYDAAGTVLLFFTGLVIYGVNCAPYVSGHSASTEFTFFRSFDEVEIWGFRGGHLMLALFTLHYLRMWLGVYFIEYDATFNEAREQRESSRKIFWEWVLRNGVKVILAAYPLSLKGSAAVVWSLLIVQAVIILTYNAIFFREYYRLDKQRDANCFIAVGDATYVCFATWVITASVRGWHVSSCEFLSPLFLGAYAAVLSGEVAAYYLSAFRIGLAEFRELARGK
jgi:hypothetical protein